MTLITYKLGYSSFFFLIKLYIETMGTNSITLIRERKSRTNGLEGISEVGGPTESQYHYAYLAFIYQHYDGYVEGGVGEWLANFICEFIHEFTNSTRWVN